MDDGSWTWMEARAGGGMAQVLEVMEAAREPYSEAEAETGPREHVRVARALEDGTGVSAGSAPRHSCDTGGVGVLRSADPGALTASANWQRRRDVPDPLWFAAVKAGFAAVDATPS